ncbi:MAG: biotin/lipoyl-binding protein [Bacteroidales bacterium]|jgi:biotin carboxyl carrier protein|nr:biotin/lipoyl-binding protein [Bacteroidales bacterium]
MTKEKKEEINVVENTTPVVEEARTTYRQIYIKINEGQVYAFIPGTILEIFVKKGQNVKKGEPLCSLHAMKMDNNICSTIDGKVHTINIKKGQNVSKNDVLIEVIPVPTKQK